MRIGGGIEKHYSTPEEWLSLVQTLSYRAVNAPIDHTAPQELKEDYKKIIAENDLVLGEVGAWVNPIATDELERQKNITYCQNQLAFAEEMKARCCVDIVGCRGETWDGAYLDNYSEDTYALIVDSIRLIIDAVKPKNAFYTVEPMPWMIPDSPESYLKLLKDVDRKAFGVHLDYTNMINNPMLYLKSSAFITHCFSLLGPYIKSVHAKDVRMENHLPCVIKEVMPGQGIIDFKLVMRLCRQINPDMTIYAEHLDSYDKYVMATSYLMKMEKDSEIGVL